MTPKLFPILLVLAAGPVLAQAPGTGAGAAPKPAAAPTADSIAANSSPEHMFGEWDTDKNQQLSLQEFKAGMEKARTTELLGRLVQQFRKSDRDNSQFLEASEYAAIPVVRSAGSGAPPLSAFDADKDQKLAFEEYLELVKAMIRRGAAAR
jgi:Ca2+-binding EF-hand superfamily protein